MGPPNFGIKNRKRIIGPVNGNETRAINVLGSVRFSSITRSSENTMHFHTMESTTSKIFKFSVQLNGASENGSSGRY